MTLWRIKAESDDYKNTDYVEAVTASRAIELFVRAHGFRSEDVRSVKRLTSNLFKETD